MSNIRIEVKLGGARHFGRFLPYGNVDPNKTLGEIAIEYLTDPKHADFIALSGVKLGSRGRGAGKRAGQVVVMVYSREQVLNAVKRFLSGVAVPSLCVHNGGVAMGKVEYSKVRQSFGIPVAEYATDLCKLDDIQPDTGCPNAPYARAWEKICAKAIGGRWVGGLNNLQIDIVVNINDD